MCENPENSPGQKALSIIKNDEIFKKPLVTPKRRKKQQILDEDTYVEVNRK